MSKNIRQTTTFQRALALARKGQIARALDMLTRFHGKRRMEARYQLLSDLGRMAQSNTQGGDAMAENTPSRLFVHVRANGVDIVAERPEGAVWLGDASFRDKVAVMRAAAALASGVKAEVESLNDFVVEFPAREVRKGRFYVARWERRKGGRIVRVLKDAYGERTVLVRAGSRQERAILRKVAWMARILNGGEYVFPVRAGSRLYNAAVAFADKDDARAAQRYVAAAARNRAYRRVVAAAVKAGHGRDEARELARKAMRRYRVLFATGMERVMSLTPDTAERMARWPSVKTVELVEAAEA